jgi:benzoylformate decarboxylase
MAAIMQCLPEDVVLIDEAISSDAGLRQFQPSGDANGYFGLRGGGIGWALPGAVGVKLALPDRPVVAIVGDGSSLYTNQALWSAAHYKVPVVFIILNNGSYRIIKQRTLALQGHAAQLDRFIGMDLVDPAIDFSALAQAFGVAAVRVEALASLTSAIREALERNGPTLIDLVLDQSFRP